MKVLVKLAFVLLMISTNAMGADFYYGTFGAIPVQVDSSLVALKFDSDASGPSRSSALQRYSRIDSLFPSSDTSRGFLLLVLSNTNNYYAFLDSLAQETAIEAVQPAYRTQANTLLFVSDELIVRFPETWSIAAIDSLVTPLGAIREHELTGMPNVWLLRNTPSSGLFTMDLANAVHELPGIQYSYPGFGNRPKKFSYNVYDYFSSYQSHVRRVIGTLNSKSVWDFSGLYRSVKVAVIDDGVAPHEDLPTAKLLQGIDYVGDSAWGKIDLNPSPGPENAHGLSCAGIIGARHSIDPAAASDPTSGVISLSPRSLILPIKIFADVGDESGKAWQQAEAFIWAIQHGAEVISNSWGWTDPFFDDPALDDAIHRATLFGRNGKGCPVFFASGNYAYSECEYPANLPYVFAVGASKPSDDRRWWFSSHGASLDALAPSSDGNSEPVWSLDQMDTFGYNPTSVSDCPPGNNNMNYMCHFGGTSAACPVAAGIAALLLAKDSVLSAESVYYILRESADTALAWGTISPPDMEYGYGIVNAFNAVLSISHGDVSNDNQIDLSDLSLLIAYLIVKPKPQIFPSIALADLNCSGGVDLSDLTWMIMYVTSTPGSVSGPVKPCFKF